MEEKGNLAPAQEGVEKALTGAEPLLALALMFSSDFPILFHSSSVGQVFHVLPEVKKLRDRGVTGFEPRSL